MFESLLPSLPSSSPSPPLLPSYDGKPCESTPLRLLQHEDEPCWLAHCYLRFIKQPYWTENIQFDIAMGTDVPVLVDRNFVMSAPTALHCIEVIEAKNKQCDASFPRYDSISRIHGLWKSIEALKTTQQMEPRRSYHIFGATYFLNVYARMKKSFFLTSSTPVYLSEENLTSSLMYMYSIVSEWLKGHVDSSSSKNIYLSGCSSPGLADAFLFAHLACVATSKAAGFGPFIKIKTEFPALYSYFVHICKVYFHDPRGNDERTCLLRQSNAALVARLESSHVLECPPDLVDTIFGLHRDYQSSLSQPLNVVGCLDRPTCVSKFQLFRNKYPSISELSSRLTGKTNTSSQKDEKQRNYVGVRCFLFLTFVVGSFVKSVVDISKT